MRIKWVLYSVLKVIVEICNHVQCNIFKYVRNNYMFFNLEFILVLVAISLSWYLQEMFALRKIKSKNWVLIRNEIESFTVARSDFLERESVC